MFSDNYCRLCVATTESLIDIFDEQGLRWNIAPIVTSHFKLELNVNDKLSKQICTTCWWKIENFHVFYLNIVQVQKELQKRYDLGDLLLPDDINTDIKQSNNEQDCKEIVNLVENDLGKSENENELKILYSSFGSNEDDSLLSDHYVSSNDILDNDNDTKVIQTYEINIERDNNVSNSDNICPEESQIKNEIDTNIEESIDESSFKLTKRSQKSPPKKLSKRAEAREKNEKKALDEDELIRNWCRMECTLCPQTFDRFPDVKTHYRSIHQLNGFIKCCNKKLFRRVRALEHIACHLDPNVFRCDICNKNFADKPGLLNHMDGHVPIEQRRYQCDKCPKSYAKKFQMDQHCRFAHMTSKDKKFICNNCGKGFSSKGILSTHLRVIHLDPKRFICDICAKIFKSKIVLENHCKVHSEVKQPRVQCPICQSWLKHEHSLRTHMYHHREPNVPNKCEFCGKESPSRRALVSHQRYVHFSERSYKCHVCDKAFKKPVALREHLTLHTGEVLYSCPYCPKTFNSSANMFSHRKKVHPVEWENDRIKRLFENN